MKDIELINRFFVRTNLDSHDARIKDKAVLLKQKLDTLVEEVSTRRSELMQKEEEVKKYNSQFDVLLQLALESEKARPDDENAENLDKKEAEQG